MDLDGQALCLVPGLCFDNKGYRLGYGKGYYDRFLPRCERAVIAAVAYELQRVDELETEPWDVAMDLVFTEGDMS